MKSRAHFIKIEPKYFLHVINKTKKFEIRNNDRKYKIDDIVVLQEYEKETNSYTGRTAIAEITYITSFRQKKNIVFFSFSGSEVLLHMSINTVDLKGALFTFYVEEGQKITRGQVIAVVDLKMLEQAGKKTDILEKW